MVFRIFQVFKKNYESYKLKIDDIILIEGVIYYWFEQPTENNTEYIDEQIIELADKGNPEAMYNLVSYYNKDKNYSKYYEKLYNINYYRSFDDYVNELPKEKQTLNILQKSISNGYYSHIKNYFRIFMMIYEFENIFKSPTLKSVFIIILKGFIDIIIVDDIEYFLDCIYMRKVLIKHFNYGNEFKIQIDPILKEIMNYLNKFMKGTDKENKNKIKSYFLQDSFYQMLSTIYGYIYFYGMNGIVERNYNETLNKYNYLLKNNDNFFGEKFYLYHIYYIKNKQRILNEKQNKNRKNDDKELIELENKLLNLFYEKLSVENIKKYPPSFFYYLSRLFRYNAINNKDLILEYVFLNRASNAVIIELNDFHSPIFEEKYIKYKANKKIKEKNKDENFKKIKEAKGAINVEGYGEDGTICPICLANKKSIIALPCKHFFCGSCMNKLLDQGICPICRTEIKITFDINLKKENLIKTILVNPKESVNSYDS